MHLTFKETRELFYQVLETAGFPAGILPTAVQMLQWSEVHHGMGMSLLTHHHQKLIQADSAAVEITAETDSVVVVDAGQQSALLVGPSILDIVSSKAEAGGAALAVVKQVSGLAWLGHIAEMASRRGLVTLLSFQCSRLDADYNSTAQAYSSGRTIVAFPNDPAPLWLDMPYANESHIYLMTHHVPLPLNEALSNAFTPSQSAPSGFSMLCWPEPAMTADAMRIWGTVLQIAGGVGADIVSPEVYQGRVRNATKNGFWIAEEERDLLRSLVPPTVIGAGLPVTAV